MATPEFALLRAFQGLFENTRYRHRDSSLGDFVASHLYEDLVGLNKSATLAKRVQAHECVVNLGNKAVGKPSRRGDGTFGELVPTVIAVTQTGLRVARGEIANIRVGGLLRRQQKSMQRYCCVSLASTMSDSALENPALSKYLCHAPNFELSRMQSALMLRTCE